MSINIKNLTLLRDYLQDKEEALSGTFDMGVYISETSSRSKTFVNIIAPGFHRSLDPFDCNTSACVLGHAALSGIPELEVPLSCISWSIYPWVVFGLTVVDDAWGYIFDSQWQKIDNTVASAIERLTYVIDHDGKVPSNYCRGGGI
jgi:hypothetical protein